MATKPPRNPKDCHYCKRRLTAPSDRARTAATRDHIIPRHMGGRRTVPCCRQCNSLKGPLHINDWREVMATYPRWWKLFQNRGELIEAQRRSVWIAAQRKRDADRWPSDIKVPLRPICRGLPLAA